MNEESICSFHKCLYTSEKKYICNCGHELDETSHFNKIIFFDVERTVDEVVRVKDIPHAITMNNITYQLKALIE